MLSEPKDCGGAGSEWVCDVGAGPVPPPLSEDKVVAMFSWI